PPNRLGWLERVVMFPASGAFAFVPQKGTDFMSYITIMQDVARNVGIRQPDSVSDTGADTIKLGQFINEAGREVARRFDWSALRKTATLTGTGTDSAYTISTDFDRLPAGLSVIHDGMPLRGSLTPDEWFAIDNKAGDPRYFYLKAKELRFYPYPKSGETIRVLYQSKNWVDASTDSDLMESDADEAFIPDVLIASGAVWRWRRH